MNILKKKYYLILITIPIISVFMHIEIFNLDLIGFHVWRQTQTQTVILNFAKEDSNILNSKVNEKADTDRIFRMEFPVMQWIFSWFYKLFGDYIIITRILSFITGLFSVLGLFVLFKTVFHDNFLAAAGAWAFNFSPIFYYYTLNPLPDNFALCMGIWCLSFFFTWVNTNRLFHFILCAFFLCLAALAKLPFILFTSVVFSYFIITIKNNKGPIKQLILPFFLTLFFLIPVLSWYISVVPEWHGNGIVSGILSERDFSQIPDILFHNIVSTLPELLINYGSLLFFLVAIFFIFKNKIYRHENFYVFALLGLSIAAYFFYEINMIGKVHDYYLFPFLPLIFILVVYGIKKMVYASPKAFKYIAFFLLFILPVTAFLRSNSRWNIASPGFNPVLYSHKNELRKLCPDEALCIAGNDVSHYIFLYYINKKGWVFDNDNLDKKKLEKWMSYGAAYLFSDSRKDTLTEVKNNIDKLIFEQGTLKVFKLKKQ